MFLFDRKPSIFKRHRALFIWGIIIVFVVLVVLVVIFAILPFLLVAGYAGFHVTESPEFCGHVCHNMKPFYESYEHSTHAGILCAECHNEPGFVGFVKGTIVGAIKESYLYISGNYDKEPINCDLSGKSCLREECHKIERLDAKEFIFEEIPFSHFVHKQEMGINIKLKCTSCHAYDSLVHMRVDIATCYLCHTTDIVSKEEPERCLDCHSKDINEITGYDHSGALKSKIPCSNCHQTEHEKVEIEQERCDLCHHLEEEKKEEFTPSQLHKIHTFDHTVECAMCHSDITHSYETAFSGNCLDCHKEVKSMKSARFRGRYFPHLRHINIASCSSCHSKKKETHGNLIIGEASCRSCHHSGKDIKCAKCHSIPNAVKNGLALGGMKGVEGYKSNTIDCKACHKKVKESSSLTKVKDACAKCHEDEYKVFVDEWQASTLESIKKIESKIKETKGTKNSEAKKLVKEAQTLLYYVRADGSKGVHNPDYSDDILKEAKKKVDKALEIIKGSE